MRVYDIYFNCDIVAQAYNIVNAIAYLAATLDSNFSLEDFSIGKEEDRIVLTITHDKEIITLIESKNK